MHYEKVAEAIFSYWKGALRKTSINNPTGHPRSKSNTSSLRCLLLASIMAFGMYYFLQNSITALLFCAILPLALASQDAKAMVYDWTSVSRTQERYLVKLHPLT